MGQIKKDIVVLGSNNKGKKLRALFDTGATRNYINENFIETNGTIYDIGINEYHKKCDVIFVDGTERQGQIIKLELLNIEGFQIKKPKFCLFNMTSCDVIIGAKLMQQLKIVLNPSIKKISFG
ncbi:hypothetical protein CEE44_04610 [Candidatus Woesearchaeota archaeon B3_Woes]|nr:MAG: hypothetical protein CEE44_04610 [Candidatus Woesearchaeota archaeon B3_Woes]